MGASLNGQPPEADFPKPCLPALASTRPPQPCPRMSIQVLYGMLGTDYPGGIGVALKALGASPAYHPFWGATKAGFVRAGPRKEEALLLKICFFLLVRGFP